MLGINSSRLMEILRLNLNQGRKGMKDAILPEHLNPPPDGLPVQPTPGPDGLPVQPIPHENTGRMLLPDGLPVQPVPNVRTGRMLPPDGLPVQPPSPEYTGLPVEQMFRGLLNPDGLPVQPPEPAPDGTFRDRVMQREGSENLLDWRDGQDGQGVAMLQGGLEAILSAAKNSFGLNQRARLQGTERMLGGIGRFNQGNGSR